MDDSPSDSKIHIPQHEIDSLARCLLPEMIKFFQNAEGQKEFEEWKKQQSNHN